MASLCSVTLLNRFPALLLDKIRDLGVSHSRQGNCEALGEAGGGVKGLSSPAVFGSTGIVLCLSEHHSIIPFGEAPRGSPNPTQKLAR